MPDPAQKKPVLLIPVRADAGDLAAAEKPLPAALQAASRGAGGGPDPFLANVVVEESYTLAAVGRGEAPDTRRIEDDRSLLGAGGRGRHRIYQLPKPDRPRADGAVSHAHGVLGAAPYASFPGFVRLRRISPDWGV